jgi:hypothetical protein
LDIPYVWDNLLDSEAEEQVRQGMIDAFFPFMSSTTQWYITGCGPDSFYEAENLANAPYKQYDPTNGTVSQGDIWRWGP